MPSGYAYAKALRTVKTCVGKQFCRFGTQDSTGLGIRMEQTFERLKTPHKVKMAVSACPRNCAESGIKDVGVVGVEGGWEIYVGGNGGTHLRAADLLCTVKTEDEVIEMTGAFCNITASPRIIWNGRPNGSSASGLSISAKCCSMWKRAARCLSGFTKLFPRQQIRGGTSSKTRECSNCCSAISATKSRWNEGDDGGRKKLMFRRLD